MAYQHYTLALGELEPGDRQGLKALIEANAPLFKRFVMSAFPDDMRYAWEPETFSVTNIDETQFRFSCSVHYFEPCADRNLHDRHEYQVPYSVRDGELAFSLDETRWVVE
ncbi:hypothetical protein [Siccibacter turicensis]|uniref:hypothetical protein n=1 Tax=Siccibacter turicensis TaxID=357233 RepID=UPI001F0DD104|nr:hypothetical protein [Siccibacter turicensis]